MFEYLVINIDGKTSEELENTLNFYARDGWKMICDTLCGIVMERTAVDIIPTATYSYTAYSKSNPSLAEE